MATKATCPKCGQKDISGPTCPRCGHDLKKVPVYRFNDDGNDSTIDQIPPHRLKASECSDELIRPAFHPEVR